MFLDHSNPQGSLAVAFFLISSELTQRRTLTGIGTNTTATPDFNVNLKARWEY